MDRDALERLAEKWESEAEVAKRQSQNRAFSPLIRQKLQTEYLALSGCADELRALIAQHGERE
ncbi:hypothetical protein AB3Y40_06615 [Yoonia sp. R2331]|uniref:hypothetical protein n=1 Tax=Yoonia sp. R2331 TaxID=3237238 RepID=UPI0034E50067